MAAATIATAGAFDPTVTNQARRRRGLREAACLVRGRDDRRRSGVVQLGATTALDPGGIGKGLAADLVVAATMDAGATAAAVVLGGDGRFASHDGRRALADRHRCSRRRSPPRPRRGRRRRRGHVGVAPGARRRPPYPRGRRARRRRAGQRARRNGDVGRSAHQGRAAGRGWRRRPSRRTRHRCVRRPRRRPHHGQRHWRRHRTGTVAAA